MLYLKNRDLCSDVEMSTVRYGVTAILSSNQKPAADGGQTEYG